MKIIVDTNIVFSALLNSNGKIGDLIFNSQNTFKFYSCNYMRFEIRKHWNKLKKISGLTDKELTIARYQLLSKIEFINEKLILERTWINAEKIAANIDIDDVDFIAMTKHMHASLWTGDKQLYKGLKKINFKVYNTSELLSLRN